MNAGSFDIEGALGRPRIMEDGIESLQTMGLNKFLSEYDNYMDIDIKYGKTQATNGTKASTFTTNTFPLANEKLFDILFKN